LNRSTWALFFGLLFAGALLRVSVNDVPVYSRADETVYLIYAKQLASDGAGAYPKIVERYLSDSKNWMWPSPNRFGYFGTIGLACKASSDCSHRTLAWVSTLAGILALVGTFLLVRELVDVPTALCAMALSVASPLQLALGRRALSDEFFCAVLLFALWAFVRAVRAPPEAVARRYVASIALTTFLIAAKETALLLAPAVLAAGFVLTERRIERRHALLLVVPIVLAYVGFSLISRSATAGIEMLRAIQAGTVGASYVEQHNSGPPHRILADLFLLSPLTVLYAVAGATLVLSSWRELSPGVKSLFLLGLLILLTMSLVAVKNVRYAVNADGLLRALAAWVLVARVVPSGPFGRRLAIALGLGLVVCDYLVFQCVFVAGAVYDPVTAELVRALKMAP
jgi:hypothetical protein